MPSSIELLYLARLAHGAVDREQGLHWYRAQSRPDRKRIVHELLDLILASGRLDPPTEARLKAAGAYRGIRSKRATSWTADGNVSFGALLDLLPSCRVSGACQHWWHRDLSDPAGLADLKVPVVDLGEAQARQDDLEEIIRSFSDPFSFLQELVHNAVDAGASRVDFDLETRPRNIFLLNVRDDGLGMTRSDLKEKLLQLQSRPDVEPERLGRYGNGFLSLFALKPKAVVLDTGRAGESTRLFFKEDATFDQISLATPVRGTQIQWIGQGDAESFLRQARASLEARCSFSRVPIYWGGESILAPFAFPEPDAVLCELSNGDRLALAPSDAPTVCFYQHGMLLADLGAGNGPGLSVRLDKRDLHWTRTRDNIVHNEAYAEGIRWVRQVAGERFGALEL